jgi:hypothetical protein
MMTNFLFAACHRIGTSELMKTANQLVDQLEQEELFDIFFQKQILFEEKKKRLAGNAVIKLIVVTNPTNLQHVERRYKGLDVTLIEEDKIRLLMKNPNDEIFLNSIVVLTNNNAAKVGVENLSEFAEAAKSTILAIHDYDNHHWLTLSLQLSIVADVYFPAHLTDLSIISRLNSSISVGVPTGSIQWKRDFILKRIEKIIGANRSNSPLGMHYYYGRFHYRNKILQTINKHYPTVGLLSSDFHSRSEDERFNEWITHKLHWISPVFGDLPIRFFDALISGGMPLVPTGLKFYLDYLKIPSHYYCVYSAADIIDPKKFIEESIKKFDEAGRDGILERMQFSLRNYHVDEIVRRIYLTCCDKLDS